MDFKNVPHSVSVRCSVSIGNLPVSCTMDNTGSWQGLKIQTALNKSCTNQITQTQTSMGMANSMAWLEIL